MAPGQTVKAVAVNNNGGNALMFLPFLRASPGLCLGDRHSDYARRGAGDPHPAGRPVPGRRPAGGENLRHLYRGVRRNPGEQRHPGHRGSSSPALDHLLYFSSTSSSDGSVSITVTFEQGTDPDTAQVQVQNTKYSRRNRGCRAKSSSPA